MGRCRDLPGERIGIVVLPQHARKEIGPMPRYCVLPAELKARVALAALSNKGTMSEIALEFGVQPAQVTQWKRHALKNIQELFNDGRGKSTAQEELLIGRLNEEIGQLRSEMAGLKRKAHNRKGK